MTLPVENQQTVEAALEQVREVLILNGYPDPDDTEHTCPIASLVRIEAALRDLVAQAELAADMGEYLRRPYSQATANALLARLDGAR